LCCSGLLAEEAQGATLTANKLKREGQNEVGGKRGKILQAISAVQRIADAA